METQTPGTPDASQVALIQKKLTLEASMRGGVGWFFWISGLSIVNSIIYFMGGSTTFVIGLGVTQLIDVISGEVAKGLSANGGTIVHVIGFVIDLVFAGLFITAGFLGQRRHRWAIITGMVFYALDGAIFLLVGSWLAVGFHAFALWGLWRGLQAINELKKLEEQAAPPSFLSAVSGPK